jgi:dCMP deaminase
MGGTLYIVGKKTYQGLEKPIDAFPCFICKKMIINAGIKKVVCSTADTKYKVFFSRDWVREWQKEDIINDKDKYGTNYLNNLFR